MDHQEDQRQQRDVAEQRVNDEAGQARAAPAPYVDNAEDDRDCKQQQRNCPGRAGQIPIGAWPGGSELRAHIASAADASETVGSSTATSAGQPPTAVTLPSQLTSRAGRLCLASHSAPAFALTIAA